MSKGFPRSLGRQNKAVAATVKDTIVLDGKTVTVTSVAAAIGFGSLQIHDFPEGNILVHGIAGTIGFAGSGADANLADTWEGDFGIGTTPAADATITGADVDIVASTASGAATAEVIAPARIASALAAALMLDNTDGSLELNLNVLIDAADIVDDESVVLTLSGTLQIAYVVLGDD
tara:strand:+ start:15764 stop:16291 length:528 start_codon:yes stop_codon:yes gene_type:complete